MAKRRLFLLLLVLAVWVLAPPAGRADFVFLNDGFTLRGRVFKEGAMHMDAASGHQIWMPKANGFYVVDDATRRTHFSYKIVSEAVTDPADRKQALEMYTLKQQRLAFSNPSPIYSLLMESVGPWTAAGQRDVEINTGVAKLKVLQLITGITPHQVRVHARTYQWYSSMLTSEFEPSQIIMMIRENFKKKPAPAGKLEERLSIARFCIQTGWYDEAEQELQAVLEELPQHKDKVGEPFKELRRLRAGRALDDVKLARKGGQHERAQRMLKDFPEEGAAAAVLQEVHSLRKLYKELLANLNATRWLLQSVNKELKNQTVRPTFEEALAEITKELNLDNCGRLEAFLFLGTQEMQNQVMGRPADLTPEELVALALSGWLLDNAGADQEINAAVRLWQARQFILRYLRMRDTSDRDQLLAAYLKTEALRFDVLAQLIELLPPVLTEPRDGPALRELTVQSSQSGTPIPCQVQLPPEYHPHRAYPVIEALHNADEDLKTVVNRWGPLTSKHGYILVAPQWTKDVFQKDYEFSEKEHGVVLDVIRDVTRRFQVNSDRIYLAGFGWSGLMAYDVGLSHPDLFAGVVVTCGRPRENVTRYRTNGQLLPFYVVEGDRDGSGSRENRAIFEYWVPRGFPSLYVEYNGRGLESFDGELPYIFDWMGRKKRPRGTPSFGMKDPKTGVLGEPFSTIRASDNHFYWLSTEELGAVGPTNPAKLSGQVLPGNLIHVYAVGFRQLSVWLNSSMVDFEQPVELRVNPMAAKGKVFKNIIKPSVKVLLEDLYQRGDKKNLFVGRVDFQM